MSRFLSKHTEQNTLIWLLSSLLCKHTKQDFWRLSSFPCEHPEQDFWFLSRFPCKHTEQETGFVIYVQTPR